MNSKMATEKKTRNNALTSEVEPLWMTLDFQCIGWKFQGFSNFPNVSYKVDNKVSFESQ